MKIKVLWIDGIIQDWKILHDCTGIKQYYVRDNTIDFVEIDPPYAIDLKKKKKGCLRLIVMKMLRLMFGC